MEAVSRDAAETDLTLLSRMNKQLIEDEHSRNPIGMEALAGRLARWMKAGLGGEAVFVEVCDEGRGGIFRVPGTGR